MYTSALRGKELPRRPYTDQGPPMEATALTSQAHCQRRAPRLWVESHPVAFYYALALSLSWSYWFAMLALGLRVEAGSAATHLPGLLGPTLAAFVLTALRGGRPALRDLLARLLHVPAPNGAKLVLALSPLALGAAAFLSLAALGRPLPGLAAFSTYPGLPVAWNLAWSIPTVLLVNGFGEEIGWRGFATERLFERHGRFQATLRLAALWGLWHLPLFWLNVGMRSLVGPMLLGWAFGLLCGAFVLAHVYVLCARSILCVALWHTAYNIMVATPAGRGLPAAVMTTAVMVWGLVVAWCWWRADWGFSSNGAENRRNVMAPRPHRSTGSPSRDPGCPEPAPEPLGNVGCLPLVSGLFKTTSPTGTIMQGLHSCKGGTSMELAYTILYVEDVRRSLDFYAKAFDLKIRYRHESGDFGELETGSTALAFASRRLMTELQKNPRRADALAPSFELAFTTNDVAAGVAQALGSGAKLIQEPEQMPWGQTVAYVADPDGYLVEICTPMKA